MLVVDDEEPMRHMLDLLLRREGYEVVTADDGQWYDRGQEARAHMRRRRWMLAGMSVGLGCASDLPDVPAGTGGTTGAEVSTGGAVSTSSEVSTGAEVTTGAEVSTGGDVSTSGEVSTTGPLTECGNGEVEEGEECDGTDWQGATCESLGHDLGSLDCTEECVFDVSGCVPPGMVLVPGGVFEMGSDVSPDEMPIRQVNVDAFWIDETEVTVEAYGACVDAGECSEPTGLTCNWMVARREDHPVNCVTWYDAEDYCGWAEGGTKRLPTEAEWEKAARGTDAREYPWGDSPAPSCSHVVMNDEGSSGCGEASTWAVGSKLLGDSPYEAHDMAGNVWEWVADWYASSYDAAETDNPTGPAMGGSCVLRGGSWIHDNTNNFRAADRDTSLPTEGYDYVGFRCARTPPAAQ